MEIIINHCYYNDEHPVPDFLDKEKSSLFTDILDSIKLKNHHTKIYEGLSLITNFKEQQVQLFFHRNQMSERMCKYFEPTCAIKYKIKELNYAMEHLVSFLLCFY